jgi:hypothetical protein
MSQGAKKPKKNKVAFPSASIDDLVAGVSRRTILLRNAKGDPYTPGYPYQPHELISLHSVIAHSDLDMVRERTSGLLCAQILFAGMEDEGAFGKVTVLFPMAQARFREVVRRFGTTWPVLTAIRQQMLAISRAIPVDPCPDVQPSDAPSAAEAKVAADCLQPKFPKTMLIRSDAPVIVPGLDVYVGESKASRASKRALMSLLYKGPSLASKSIKKELRVTSKTVQCLRLFMSAHEGTNEERWSGDEDHIIKVFRVDDLDAGDDDGGLNVITEGVHLSLADWKKQWPRRSNTAMLADRDHMCRCLKFVNMIFSIVTKLGKEKLAHMDIKTNNVGVMFYPLRYFLLDLDCVSTLGLPYRGCTTFLDPFQLRVNGKKYETEGSYITNIYAVYADLFRASFALEDMLFDSRRGDYPMRVAPEETLDSMTKHTARVEGLITFIRSKSPSDPKSLLHRAHNILVTALSVQLTVPRKRPAHVRLVLTTYAQFARDFAAEMEETGAHDFVAAIPQKILDSTAIRFCTKRLI